MSVFDVSSCEGPGCIGVAGPALSTGKAPGTRIDGSACFRGVHGRLGVGSSGARGRARVRDGVPSVHRLACERVRRTLRSRNWCPPAVLWEGVARSRSKPRNAAFRGVDGCLVDSSGRAAIPHARGSDAKHCHSLKAPWGLRSGPATSSPRHIRQSANVRERTADQGTV